MEDIFNKLQAQSKNTVDGLVKWIKDAKLVEATKDGEEKARALFNDVANKNNVELAKFKEVITKLASDQHKSFEDMSKQLAAQGPKIQKTLTSGLNALKDAFKR